MNVKTYSHWRLGNKSSDISELSLILLLFRNKRLRLTRPLKAVASMCWMSFFDRYKKRSCVWWRNTSAAIDSILFSSKCLYLFVYFWLLLTFIHVKIKAIR